MSEDKQNQTQTDPRHQKRIHLMNLLFAYSFRGDKEPDKQIADIVAQLAEIDKEIQAIAPERPLEEINRVDLAILRLIVFEAKSKKTPKKVLINEAVELAKAFGSENSSKFVNGALSKLFN